VALSAKAIRNVGVYAAPKFLSYGLNLLALPILTRILSPQDFGVVAMAMVLPAMATTILDLGTGSGTQRSYFVHREDEDALGRLFRSTQLFLFGSLLLAAPFVWLFREQLALVTIGGGAYGLALFLAYVAAASDETCNYYLTIFQSMEKAGTYSFFVAARSVVQVTTSLVAVALLGMGYLGPLTGSLVGGLVATAGMAVHLNRGRSGHFDLKILVEALMFGVQIIPKTFMGLINRFFDKYMLNSMLSLTVVGLYSVGQQVGGVVFSLMNVFWLSLQPGVYRDVFDRAEGAAESVGRVFTIFSYAGTGIVVALILAAEQLMVVFAPSSYAAAIDVAILVACATSTQLFGVFVGVQYAYAKKAYLVFPMSVAGTLVGVGANIALIPRFGLYGAGTALILSSVVLNSLLAWMGQRLVGIRYEWHHVAGFFAMVGLAAAAALWAHNGPDLVVGLAAKAAVAIAFLVMGRRAGILDREHLRLVVSAVARPGD
jgi:O-antigen/teichoic acid export membrane protein